MQEDLSCKNHKNFYRAYAGEKLWKLQLNPHS